MRIKFCNLFVRRLTYVRDVRGSGTACLLKNDVAFQTVTLIHKIRKERESKTEENSPVLTSVRVALLRDVLGIILQQLTAASGTSPQPATSSRMKRCASPPRDGDKNEHTSSDYMSIRVVRTKGSQSLPTSLKPMSRNTKILLFNEQHTHIGCQTLFEVHFFFGRISTY